MLSDDQARDAGILEQNMLAVVEMLDDPDRYLADYTYEAGFVLFLAGVGEYVNKLSHSSIIFGTLSTASRHTMILATLSTQRQCGARTSSGEVCKNRSGSCPHHPQRSA